MQVKCPVKDSWIIFGWLAFADVVIPYLMKLVKPTVNRRFSSALIEDTKRRSYNCGSYLFTATDCWVCLSHVMEHIYGD